MKKKDERKLHVTESVKMDVWNFEDGLKKGRVYRRKVQSTK
jgi:hypothetical protein